LQPKPGVLDADWSERFEQIVQAADAIGMHAWACLHEDSIPRWFDNDGGFDDEENVHDLVAAMGRARRRAVR
jgi:hypothetical protein